MGNKASTAGKVYDRMDRLCDYLLAFDSSCPMKYRRSLWEPLMHYMNTAQACAEMAYLEPDKTEKARLMSDARKHFRVFKRYWSRCDKTGEFRFGSTKAIDMVEFIQTIEEELDRWFASHRKMLVRESRAAADSEHRE